MQQHPRGLIVLFPPNKSSRPKNKTRRIPLHFSWSRLSCFTHPRPLPAIRCIHCTSGKDVRCRTGVSYSEPGHISGTVNHRSGVTDRNGAIDRCMNNRTNMPKQTDTVCDHRRTSWGKPSSAIATYPARDSGTKFTRAGSHVSTGFRHGGRLLGTGNICR